MDNLENQDIMPAIDHDAVRERQISFEDSLMELMKLERHQSAAVQYRAMKKALNAALEVNEEILYRGGSASLGLTIRLAARVSILSACTDKYVEFKQVQPGNDEVDLARIEVAMRLQDRANEDGTLLMACADEMLTKSIMDDLHKHGNYVDYSDLKGQKQVIGKLYEMMNGTYTSGDHSSREFTDLRKSMQTLRSSLNIASNPETTKELSSLVLDELGREYDVALKAAETYSAYKVEHNTASDTEMLRMRLSKRTEISLRAFRPLLNPQIFRHKSTEENLEDYAHLLEEAKKAIQKIMNSKDIQLSPAEIKKLLCIIMVDYEVKIEQAGIKAGTCGEGKTWKPVISTLIEKGRLAEALRLIAEREVNRVAFKGANMATLRKYAEPEQVQALRRSYDKFLRTKAPEITASQRSAPEKSIPVKAAPERELPEKELRRN